MKANLIRFWAVLIILALAIFGILWATDSLSDELLMDSAKKTFSILGILALSTTVISLFVKRN